MATCIALTGSRSAMREADAMLQGGLARARGARGVSPRAGRARRRPVSSRALRGGSAARRPLVWVRQDFSEIESGALSMSGLAELGLDPRLLVTVRAADVESALRTAGRCARLRCARRRRAGGLGRGAAARSRRQPQADAGGAGLRRHRPAAAAGGAAAALDRGDAMDRARGAFAAGRGAGARGARRVFDAQLVRNRHGPVGRWIMEWKCDECLFC